jgi:hypothetical protein
MRQLEREHLRLVVLRLLSEAMGRTANTALLTDAVGLYGLAATRDQVETEVAWLEDQYLVVRAATGRVIRVTASDDGLDVAAGRRVVSGIRVPSREEGADGTQE